METTLFVVMETTEDNNNMPSPRLCIIHRRPDFQGYGFNLHTERGKTGQFIGIVDEDSPASDAGLKASGRHHAKRSLMARVGVIPKEGRARGAAPALLLV